VRRYLRIFSLVLLLVLLATLAFGCAPSDDDPDEPDDKPNTDTDTDTDTDPDDTEKPDAPGDGTHTHTSAKPPISQTASTCCVNGVKKYRCDTCGEVYSVSQPLTGHTYLKRFDAQLGQYVEGCKTCTLWRMQVTPNQKYEFAALCGGDVSLTLDVRGSGAEVTTYTDTAGGSTHKLDTGINTVKAASSLSDGAHTFAFEVKGASGSVYITDISVNGSLHAKGGVILELTDSNSIAGGSYNDFYVYTRTSDPSGNYYIRYRLRYYYSTVAADKANTANNINMFRINDAYLVKVDSVSDTAVSCTVLNSVLSTGEISSAIREKDSVDFIGGYFGDEHIINMSLTADGVTYTPKNTKRAIVCSHISFKQLTVMNRCNTPNDNILNHDQNYSITSGGINCKRSIEWLKSGYEYTDALLTMFTAKRIDKSDTICEIVETFDEGGASLGKQTVSGEVSKDYRILEDPLVRTVKYSSADSGYSATVGFKITGGPLAVDTVYVQVRKDATGDNKFFASFKSTDGSKVSKAGDKWELDVFYALDYVAGAIPAHIHESSTSPTKTVASTCTSKGREYYTCDICRRTYYKELAVLSHSYQSKYNPQVGYSTDVCKLCDGWRLKTVNGTLYEFYSYGEGNIDLTFYVGGTTATIALYLDGVQVSSAKYAKGTHTLSLAKLVSLGEHKIGIKVTGADGTVYLNKVSAGELHRKGALILEMTQTTTAHGGKYNDFYLYVQTSDPSGEYYIRYGFLHDYNTTATGVANSANNINSFRIKTAELVKVSAVSTANNTVTYTKVVNKLLNGGEIAVAIREVGAVDYVGGFHGEEHIKSLTLKADGVSYTPGSAKKVVVCSYVEFNQLTVVNRCNKPDEKVFEHGQNYRITTNGIKVRRTVKWLTSDFTYDNAFLNMFTLMRKQGTTAVCDTVEVFDKDGKSLGKETINQAVSSQYSILSNPNTTSARYSNSTNSGFTAEVGFEILNGSCMPDSVRIAVRPDSTGDNKWYAAFKSTDGSKTSKQNEDWEMDVLYHIDYVKP